VRRREPPLAESEQVRGSPFERRQTFFSAVINRCWKSSLASSAKTGANRPDPEIDDLAIRSFGRVWLGLSPPKPLFAQTDTSSSTIFRNEFDASFFKGVRYRDNGIL
jgi:hypothetical protein